MYKLIEANYGGSPCVRRLSDGACIPFDPANTDYAEYLKWLDAGGIVLAADAAPVAEGNTPLPADEELPQ
jgi:hypothetical protein